MPLEEENHFRERQIVVESFHPLYLSPSDNPGIILVFLHCDGTGYADLEKVYVNITIS